MAQKNPITNQDQQIIVETQVPESRDSGNHPVDAAVSECGSEASEKVDPSIHTTEQEAGERNGDTTNVQKAESQDPHRARRGPAGRQHRVTQRPAADDEQPAGSGLNKVEKVGKSSSRKSTGPRTAQGKLRSKYNAVKHGGLSKKLLIKGESQADNEALWNGLWEDHPPKNTLAREIFMDIFMTLLNRRRFHMAKNAMIAEKVRFSEIDGREMQQAHAWYLERWGRAEDGMLKPGGNQFVLKRCLEILEEVRCSVEKHGFILKKDGDLLRKLFGDDMDGTPLGLADFYRLLAARCAPLVEGEEGNVDADKLKRIMLRLLDFEIERVMTLEKAVQGRERIRRKYIVDQAFVLSQEASDLDMRYEAHFTRELARKLILFEQAQRMCHGLPNLPPGKVGD